MIRQNQDVIRGLCSPAFLKPFGAEQRGPAPAPAPARTARGPAEPCDSDVTPPSTCLAPQQPRNTRLLQSKGAAGSWCLRAAASCLWGGAQHPSGMCFLPGLAMGTPGNPNPTVPLLPDTAQQSDTCVLQVTGRWQIPGKASPYPTSVRNRQLLGSSASNFLPSKSPDSGSNWRFILLAVHCYSYGQCEDGVLSTNEHSRVQHPPPCNYCLKTRHGNQEKGGMLRKGWEGPPPVSPGITPVAPRVGPQGLSGCEEL